MKNIVSVALVVVFGLGLSGCNKEDQNHTQQVDNKRQQSGLGSWEPIPEENNGKMPSF